MVMKVSYHIDAPVEKVFDYFKDPASDAGLGYDVVESKMTQEGVGTFLRWRIKVGRVPVYQGFEVITDLVPNKHITEKSSRALVGTWDYSFAKEGAGTRVTMEHRPGSFWGLPPFSNVVDYSTTRLSERYISQVKAKLEGQTADKTEKAMPAQRRKPAAKKPVAPR